jgi:hypothetical protein
VVKGIVVQEKAEVVSVPVVEGSSRRLFEVLRTGQRRCRSKVTSWLVRAWVVGAADWRVEQGGDQRLLIVRSVEGMSKW